jgi:hypothetical protein
VAVATRRVRTRGALDIDEIQCDEPTLVGECDDLGGAAREGDGGYLDDLAVPVHDPIRPSGRRPDETQ